MIPNEKTMHKKKLECIAKKIYKFFRALSQPTMNDFLK